MLDFLHKDSHQAKVASGTTSFGQIWEAGFFDHQYLRKDSSDLLDVLQGDNHQEKVACETAFYVWVWPTVAKSSSLHDFLIINICGKNQVILIFFAWKQSSNEDYCFLIGCGLWCLSFNQIEGFFDQ